MPWLKLSIPLLWQYVSPSPQLLPLSGSHTPGLQYTYTQLPEAPDTCAQGWPLLRPAELFETPNPQEAGGT